jgi:hypothetical protein
MSCTNSIRAQEKEQQKEVVKVSAMPTEKQMVATEQERVQA